MDKPIKSPRAKLDLKKLADAVSEGKSLSESAKIAGSRAKSRAAQAGAAANALKRKPELKQDIVERLEDRQDQMLKALNKGKIEKSSGYQLVIMTATIIDKIQLLKGLPTARVDGDINFAKMSKADVKKWLTSYISRGTSN